MLTVEMFSLLEEIAFITNNRKLMLQCMTSEQRKLVPILLDAGLVKRSTFLEAGDSVEMTTKGMNIFAV